MGETPRNTGTVAASTAAVLDIEVDSSMHDSTAVVLPDAAQGRRRFTLASAIGATVAAVPFLWLLWGAWEPPALLRKLSYQTNFYDIQARAMLHGGLAIPKGSIGDEGNAYVGRPGSAPEFDRGAASVGRGPLDASLRGAATGLSAGCLAADDSKTESDPAAGAGPYR